MTKTSDFLVSFGAYEAPTGESRIAPTRFGKRDDLYPCISFDTGNMELKANLSAFLKSQGFSRIGVAGRTAPNNFRDTAYGTRVYLRPDDIESFFGLLAQTFPVKYIDRNAALRTGGEIDPETPSLSPTEIAKKAAAEIKDTARAIAKRGKQ